MPKCIQCNETYAEQLRRCPYCGDQPDARPSAELKSPETGLATPVSPIPEARRKRLLSRLVIYAALALLLGGVSVVFMVGNSGTEPEVVANPTPQRRTMLNPVEAPKPGPPDEVLTVTHANLEGDEIVVVGTCSPKIVVAVLVEGKPAVLSSQGTSFIARVPGGKAVVEVIGLAVGGKEVRREATVTAPADGSGTTERITVTSHAEGATVHGPDVTLEFESTTREAKLKLVRVRNEIPVGKGRFVLFRAPKGLVYLRTTETGHHAFLRERDNAEMILLPAGVSRRGMTKEPPHGPKHVIHLAAHLMDRAEVSCRQYSVFLQHVRRANDFALRHPADPGVELRPLEWAEDVYPDGWGGRAVIGVTWFGAFAYSRWVGGRLPTEAEWERAAAGPLGSPYPWGEKFDGALCRANAPTPTDAVSLPAGASRFGLLHMSGNAREWCGDRYDPRWYLRSSRSNPRGPSRNRHRVVRGGSYSSSSESLRAQHRDNADPVTRPRDVGFRVVIRWVAFDRAGDD